MKIPKKVLTLHDICTIGRCSTVTAATVLASCGVQPCPIVSTTLTSQVDGFDQVFSIDTVAMIEESIRQYTALGLTFDGIYTGYLANAQQIGSVVKLIDAFRTPENLVVIDPVMGDNGELYPTFTQEMVEGMKQLIQKADIILPNVTEAKLLVGLSPRQPLTTAQAVELIRTLSSQSGASVVITGANLPTHPQMEPPHHIKTLCCDRETLQVHVVRHPVLQAHYPGSGDLFGSVLVASLQQGLSLPQACRRASGFVYYLLGLCQNLNQDWRLGIPYEPYLHTLYDDSFLTPQVQLMEYKEES